MRHATRLALLALALPSAPALGQRGTMTALQAEDGRPDDRFGAAVELRRGEALVGAPEADLVQRPFVDISGGSGGGPTWANTGAVYAFARGANGWSQVQKLTASDARTGDEFGASLASHGRWLAVGATYATVAGHEGAGAVYLFERTPVGWIERHKLVSHDAWPSGYGYGLEMDGGRLFAGDGWGVDVYRRSGGAWPWVESVDAYSWAMDVEGELMLASNVDHGVRVYRRVGGAWTFEQDLGGGPHEYTGVDVLQHEGALLLGNPRYLYGEAYSHVAVYEHNGASWVETARLENPAPSEGFFGESLAVADGRLAVGAVSSWGAFAGAVHLYRQQGGPWVHTGVLRPPDGLAGQGFGWALSARGGGLLVGASGPPGGPGRAYLFEGLDAR